MPRLSANLRSLDRDNGQAGVVAPSMHYVYTSTVAVAANRAYLARFVPSRNMTATGIRFAVSAASGVDDSVDVGIYNSALDAKLASSGATAGLLNNGTGTKSASFTATVELAAGTVYYAAWAASATGATLVSAAAGNANAAILFGSTVPNIDMAIKDSSYTLPSSISSPTAPTGTVLMAVLG